MTHGIATHGQTIANIQRIIQGHSDTPLTELGIEQAELLGKFLKSSGHNSFDRVYTSDQERAATTCNIVCSYVNVPANSMIEDVRLRERKYDKYEGKLIHEFQLEAYSHGYNESDFTHYTPDGVESMDLVMTRVQNFLRRMCHECKSGDEVLVVTHWATIKEFLKLFQPFSDGLITKNHLVESPNAAFSEFKIECTNLSSHEIGDLIASVQVICLHQTPHLSNEQTSINIKRPLE